MTLHPVCNVSESVSEAKGDIEIIPLSCRWGKSVPMLFSLFLYIILGKEFLWSSIWKKTLILSLFSVRLSVKVYRVDEDCASLCAIYTGLYDIHIQLAGVPLLGWEPPPLSATTYASEVGRVWKQRKFCIWHRITISRWHQCVLFQVLTIKSLI